MIGFDSNKYLEEEYKAILDRISKFNGKLYLEIGGQLLFDRHASSVLPGFDPTVKVKILKKFDNIEFLFCVNNYDIFNNRPIDNGQIDYIQSIIDKLDKLKTTFNKPIHVVINLLPTDGDIDPTVLKFINEIQSLGYLVFKRYAIDNYPNDVEKILSGNGFGRDDYITTTSKLVIVTGPASNSGKLSTCLGQIYLDKLKGIESGYAKYELFPIWNLPVNHPINLAYEAATADIGDFNEVDKLYDVPDIDATNYNRDVEAFKIIDGLGKKIVSDDSYLKTYTSPTSMGINMAGFCIINDRICRVAAIKEIKSRIKMYKQLLSIGKGYDLWVRRAQDVLIKAQKSEFQFIIKDIFNYFKK